MQRFTSGRSVETRDEFWVVQHPPVFTRGLRLRNRSCEPIHSTPVVQSDRGGDITYHGPGQIIVYVLIDLVRSRLPIKSLVHALEQSVIDLLGYFSVNAQRHLGAPGVYVNGKKIAALGLRVRQGRSYHGLALNVDMDLAPFSWIAPCGYPGLEATQLTDLGVGATPDQAGESLCDHLLTVLSYNAREGSELQSLATGHRH